MSPQRTFPNNATSVAEARRFVRDALGAMAPASVDAIAVMVSELTANAVRHAASHFTVTVDRTPAQIQVSVHDNGAGLPVVRAPEPVDPTGRGLRIVQALAADWGVVPAVDGQGKTVWFTVAAEIEHTDEPALREREEANPVERRDVKSSDTREPPRKGGPGRGFACRARLARFASGMPSERADRGSAPRVPRTRHGERPQWIACSGSGRRPVRGR